MKIVKKFFVSILVFQSLSWIPAVFAEDGRPPDAFANDASWLDNICQQNPVEAYDVCSYIPDILLDMCTGDVQIISVSLNCQGAQNASIRCCCGRTYPPWNNSNGYYDAIDYPKMEPVSVETPLPQGDSN